MPVLSIIGGYLGTGKSTVVNHLLRQVLEGRTAVVVNDFGAVNIDAALISSRGEDTIELTNGCICCQITDDVQRTMSALARRTDLSHVVCEVSGVADPEKLGTWRKFPGFSPGPMLVCADATATRRLLRDEFVGDVVARQFAAAEAVLVTKTDLATAAQVRSAVTLLRAAAPHAKLHVQDPADPTPTLRRLLRECFGHAGGMDEPSTSPGITNGHAEAHRSITLSCPELAELPLVLEVLSSHAHHLVRAKGMLRDACGTWHDIQLAGGRVTSAPHPSDLSLPAKPCLVLIAAGPGAGKHLRAAVTRLTTVLPGSKLWETGSAIGP